MKRILSILLTALFILTAITVASAAEENASDMLIVYFTRVGISDFEPDVDVVTSASLNLDENGELIGNSAIAAGFIHDVIDADVFQIITEQRYPSDYDDTTDLAADEQDDDVRPALSSHVENMDAYSTIFLVYPNWWGQLPMAVDTFLEEYDFSGKTIVPLCTHEGSGLGGTPREIERLAPDATPLKGLSIRGGRVANSRETVNDWLRELGFIQ